MQPCQSVCLAEYSRSLSDAGIRVYPGSSGTVWVGYFKGSATRLPTHCLNVPTPSELREIFSHSCYVAVYIVPPDDRHPANKWLYLADSTTYDPEKLSHHTRRNIRRAQKSLYFSDLSWDELRTYGEPSFCETRTRLGHPDRTSEHFQRHVTSFSRNPAHFAIGAWLENRLIAFATFAAVEDWVEWIGMFSTDADRPNHPSDGMYHYILNRFLFEEKRRVVCAGVGSAVDTPGLHQFKLRNGFQGIPVRRTFSSPAWMRPLLNPATLFAARTALRWNPKNRRLEKAVKALQEIVQPAPLLADQADQGEDTNDV